MNSSPKESHVKMVGKRYRDGSDRTYIVTGISHSKEPMVSFREEGSERTKIKTLKWFKEHMYQLFPSGF